MTHNLQRRITIHTDDGVQHYSVVRVERTSVPDTYRLHIDSSGGVWLRAGSYGATMCGKGRVSGNLALIDYWVKEELCGDTTYSFDLLTSPRAGSKRNRRPSGRDAH